LIDRILRERWVLSSHTMAEALLEKDIKLVQDQITDLREDMGRVDGRSVEDSMLRESLQIRLQYSLMELATLEVQRAELQERTFIAWRASGRFLKTREGLVGQVLLPQVLAFHQQAGY